MASSHHSANAVRWSARARETGGQGRYGATIDASGRFVVPHIRLRKIADNTSR